jgi:hypothetical protein
VQTLARKCWPPNRCGFATEYLGAPCKPQGKDGSPARRHRRRASARPREQIMGMRLAAQDVKGAQNVLHSQKRKVPPLRGHGRAPIRGWRCRRRDRRGVQDALQLCGRMPGALSAGRVPNGRLRFLLAARAPRLGGRAGLLPMPPNHNTTRARRRLAPITAATGGYWSARVVRRALGLQQTRGGAAAEALPRQRGED